MYNPKPADTSEIVLSGKLIALTEKIAENVHDIWAEKRFAEGWVYGDKRDDAKKLHPCLIPYNELPESEKENFEAYAEYIDTVGEYFNSKND